MDISSLLTSSLGASSSSTTALNALSSLDTDGDGQFSLEEFSAGAPDNVTSSQISALFEAGDTNQDGYLSEDELAAMQPPPPPQGGTGSGVQIDDDLMSKLIELMDTSTVSETSSETDETLTVSSEEASTTTASTTSSDVMDGEDLFAFLQEQLAASSSQSGTEMSAQNPSSHLSGFGLL